MEERHTLGLHSYGVLWILERTQGETPEPEWVTTKILVLLNNDSQVSDMFLHTVNFMEVVIGR